MEEQETLEEAAERYASYNNDYVQLANGEHDFNEEYKNAFINGAKWQQEQENLGKNINNYAKITDEEYDKLIKVLYPKNSSRL